jgi:hypothetical protein
MQVTITQHPVFTDKPIKITDEFLHKTVCLQQEKNSAKPETLSLPHKLLLYESDYY